MRLYTELSSSDCDGTRRPSPMLNVAKPTDFQRRTSSDALSASSPENSTTFFPNLLFPLNRRAPLQRHKKDLTVYRSINAVVESFFGLLKRERVNRVRYRTREEARADLFEYIEVFYNRKRRHGYLGNISPDDFEKRSTGSF